VAVTVLQHAVAFARVRRRSGLRRAMQRKSAIAFLMTLPLILLVGGRERGDARQHAPMLLPMPKAEGSMKSILPAIPGRLP
jgi:hypothetical protein